MADVIRIGYTIFVGLPLCLLLMTFGFMLCLTIVGIPAGLTLMALGNKLLTLR